MRNFTLKLFFTLTFLALLSPRLMQGQVIFSEDFNGPTLPAGWSLINGDGLTPNAAVAYVSSAWVLRTDTVGTDSMMVSTSWYTPAGGSDDWLITPVIPLTTNNVLNWQAQAPDAAYPDGYEVRISTTTPTTGGFLANPALFTQPAEAQVWTDYSVNLDAAGYSSTNVYIAFRNTSFDQFLLFIDNVTVSTLGGPDAELTSITIPTEYVFIPLPQVPAMPIEGVVTNVGVGTITSVTMTVNIDQNGTPITTLTGSTPSITAGGSATLNAGTYMPADTGLWTYEYIVSVTEADGNTSNDSLFYSFIVDDSVYGRDLGTIDVALGFNGGTGSFTQNFDVNVADDLTSVSFFVNGPTLGDQTQLEVWSVSADTPLTLIATSSLYTFTTADTGGNFINVPFATPVTLAPGTYSVGINQIDTNNITLAGSNGRWFADRVYFNGGGGWTALEDAAFFNAWIVRANFGGGVACPSITVSTTPTNTTCGLPNGAATASGAGSSGFTYSWSNGSTGSSVTGLASGTYTVTATDGDGCTGTGSVVIGASSGATASISSSSDADCGLTNGSATATGGVSYAWSSGATTATASGLAPGTYTVTVTDGSGCTAVATATIGSVSTLAGSVSGTNTTCGSPNGSATATATGGTPSYSYIWSNGATTAGITGVAAGSYSVTINDAAGCSDIQSITLTNTPGPSASIASTTAPSSCGASDGSATATQSGGTPGYSYNWSTGSTSALASGLAAGTYTVTVTDANGCTSMATASISDPAAPSASISSFTNPHCGLGDGSATAAASGGTPGYTFLWSSGDGTTTATGLTAGTYTVTVTDAGGCTATNSVVLTDIPGPSVSISSTIAASCGLSNGSASSSVTGGSAPLSYAWNTSPTTTTSSISLVSSGTYTVTVTDGFGCTGTATASIGDTPPPTAAITATSDPACGASDGSATVTGSGGSGSYSYSWSTAPVQTTATATGLSAGSYTVTVTDVVTSCTVTQVAALSSTTGPSLSTSNTDATCGNNNGSASVTASAGTPGYTYSWSNGATSATASSLTAGTYTVSVTDAATCVASASIVVGDIAGPTASTGATTSDFCGDGTGTATVSVAGGTPSYSYLWSTSPPQTGITATSLAAGSYTVTVTDGNACASTASFTVPLVAGPTASISSSLDAHCGQADGAATVAVSGGGGSNSYLWNTTPPQTSTVASGIPAGTYSVTVTDVNTCSDVATVTIADLPGPTATIVLTNDESCGDANGLAQVSGTSGTPSYAFLWSNGQTTAVATGLAAGTYTATVTDAAGCTATAAATITNTAGPAVSVSTFEDEHCGSADGTATVTATGGTSPFTYSWSTSPVQTTATATGLSAGSYTVSVTDGAGCVETSTVTIANADAPSVTVSASTDPSCAGDADGTATADGTGGSGALSYTWSTTPAQTTATASGLGAGSYTVTVTDAFGCESTASATITDPTVISTTVSATEADPGTTDGTATVTASGGTGTLTYLWSDGQTTATATGLSAGVYTVTVTDANGCTAVATAEVPLGVSIYEEFGNATISVYPNPSSGRFNLDIALETAENLTVRVYNKLGQTVYMVSNDMFMNGVFEIDLNHVTKGVYFLDIRTETVKATRKVVLTK